MILMLPVSSKWKIYISVCSSAGNDITAVVRV